MRPKMAKMAGKSRLAWIAAGCGVAMMMPALAAAQAAPPPSAATALGLSFVPLIATDCERGAAATPPRSLALRHHHLRRRHLHRAPGAVEPDRMHFVSLQVGSFDPQGDPGSGSFVGLRTGTEFGNRLTLAFNADATWRAFTEEITIAQEVDPNGNLITTSLTSLATSSTLIPLGVSLGLRLPGSRTLTPFVGVGIAYEILVNDLHDYTTGFEDTNVYGGPGWQLFGGLMVPVTRGARLLGELWMNDAEVSRSVDRYEQGLPVRESIDVSGLGARIGVEFSFQ